jgi:hypothetical protein
MTVIEIEYVDYGPEYDLFGKVVAKSVVRGFTAEQIDAEITEMKQLLGDHIVARIVEEVAAV